MARPKSMSLVLILNLYLLVFIKGGDRKSLLYGFIWILISL